MGAEERYHTPHGQPLRHQGRESVPGGECLQIQRPSRCRQESLFCGDDVPQGSGASSELLSPPIQSTINIFYFLKESKHRKTDRGLYFVIKKKEDGPYWPRLLSGNKKVCVIVVLRCR